MPVVNPLARELVFKIVYYGPGLGGKTTTLQTIHATSKPEHRGKMVSLATPVDRTLYFDFLPIRIPNVRGMAVRLQLFTVPGQVYYNATRKLVLTGADGVVMVYDSQQARLDANIESLQNLQENLREHGRQLQDVPHAIAYNKRDLYEIYTIEELEEKLNPFGAPSFATIAPGGDGVYETLDAVTRAVLEDFERRAPQGRDVPMQQLSIPEGGLADALRRVDGGAASTADADSARVTATAKGPVRRPSGVLRLSDYPAGDPPGETAARAIVEVGAARGARGDGRDSSDTPGQVTAAETNAPRVPHETETRLGSSETPVAASASTQLDASPPQNEIEIESSTASAPSEPPRSSRVPRASGRPLRPSGASFAELWPVAERDMVSELEVSIGAAEHAYAVTLAGELVARVLAAVASHLGSAPEAPRDPSMVALLLGLDGTRYLAFRSLVREARAGRDIEHTQALSAFAFAIEARLAKTRVFHS